MSQRYEKLKTLLRELFQLDQPELDFGFYRVMHAKSAEVTQFLDDDLLPQVKQAFAEYQPADKAALEKQLAEAIEQAQALGADPETLPKVLELRKRLAEDAVDLDGLEAEVYDHIYSFFRRYYSEGDFLSKRVYKEGVYSIPYEGEEVKLHWANADQYYIKTSEYLRDYAFRLRPDDESTPMRVHFRLIDAEEGEHGNVKEASGRERRFALVDEAPVSVEDGQLVVRFTYQPDGEKQKALNASAEEELLGLTGEELTPWIEALGAKHVRTDGTTSEATRLRVHLDRYTARNTFDYFIHKDLGGFLRRELDFYIKNEVMHLDDIEDESVPRVEQYLSKIKVIRRVAGKIIAFLAQLEDFQKKLWLKKKFVVETSWCVRVGCVPDEFLEEIVACDAQVQEWIELCSIDEIAGDLTIVGYTDPITPEFLRGHPTLMVDTRHFDADFVARLLDVIGDVDELTDGVLFHSENFQALGLMQARYEGRIQCVYIDPPYNAPKSEIAYKNSYKHSSFLSLIEGRLCLSRTMNSRDGSHVVAIDKNERNGVFRVLCGVFPDRDNVAVTIEHNRKGVQDQHFSFTHEYAIFSIPEERKALNQARRAEADWEYSNFRNWGGESLRTDAANCFYSVVVRDGEIIDFGEVWTDYDAHPASSNVRLDDGSIEIFPIDREGTERKWRYERGTVERIIDRLRVEESGDGLLQVKIAKTTDQFKTVWYSPRYNAGDNGTRLVRSMGVPLGDFDYPKSIHNVRDCMFAISDRRGHILDYFAGSGTTGHAVVNLNREDAGERRFILVEMGPYFDTVLLPRLKKVTFTPEWKDGKPKRLATQEEAERSPRMMKVVRLESYEDTLNNLQLARTDEQQSVLDLADSDGADKLREEYLLEYMLDVETRGSQSLLNIGAFTDPTAYRLRVKRPGSDESQDVDVDLLETFNWLVGLTVRHIAAPQTFDTDTQPDDEGRLRLKGRLKPSADGPWWFRTITGTTPDGRNALVIWRKRPGGESAEGIEQDNLLLDEWFTKQGYSSKDSEFDVIWVNGDNNLENLKAPDDTWKVRLLEDDFHRLMFDTDGV
jgi:adenine-specific DNA-methyltransferase